MWIRWMGRRTGRRGDLWMLRRLMGMRVHSWRFVRSLGCVKSSYMVYCESMFRTLILGILVLQCMLRVVKPSVCFAPVNMSTLHGTYL